MPIWTQHTPRWLWAYFYADPTRSDWLKYLEHAHDFMHHCDEGAVSIHVIFRSPPIDATQRAEISQIINTTPHARLIAGNAIATDSMFTRGILTTINWIAKKPFDEKIFAHPNDAHAWLTARSSAQVCAEMFRDMLTHVPPQTCWAGLSPAPSPPPLRMSP
jgi:hypothetical protein